MKKYIPILKKTKLFAGLGEDEILSMLTCLDARAGTFGRGEYVLRSGERLTEVIVLCRGLLHIQRDDYWGNRSILSVVKSGEMLGEAYAAPESGPLLNDAVAVEECEVIFLNVGRLITTCSSACRFHSAVVRNMFFAISEKNRGLVQKLGHMARRSTREKLISYLSDEAKKHNSPEFSIPFNRRQLADFLSVDRSAMSAELCRMRDEGLLEFERNTFKLLSGEEG